MIVKLNAKVNVNTHLSRYANSSVCSQLSYFLQAEDRGSVWVNLATCVET